MAARGRAREDRRPARRVYGPPGGRGCAPGLPVAGLGNIAGLPLVSTALREGKVGIVGPIVSTEGAIAAVLAVLAGERRWVGRAAMLGLSAGGIALATTAADSDDVSEVATAVERHRSVPVVALLA